MRRPSLIALAAAGIIGSSFIAPSVSSGQRIPPSGYQRPAPSRWRSNKRSPADRLLQAAQERRKEGAK